MAIIPQRNLFSWRDVEVSSDLERLKMVMEGIKDEGLMERLEEMRKGKRDDYPVRAVWNSILAGIVYQHSSIESLRRELKRNGELRELCGFSPLLGDKAVPSKYAYNRFLKKVIREQVEIDRIFDKLIDELKGLLPDLGEHLAIDSKALRSYAVGKRDPKESSDPTADWGVKTYRWEDRDGNLWEKTRSWFGYKVHLIVDTKYEVPLRYEVTKASVSDTTRLISLVEGLNQRHGDVIGRAKDMAADRGYDSEENNRKLYDIYGIKPVIDIRESWDEGKRGEIKTRPLYEDRVDMIVYDNRGRVYCHCGRGDDLKKDYAFMVYGGFEARRKTLKYRCPGVVLGIRCENREICGHGKYGKYGRVVRIPIKRDRRLWTPIARSSYRFERIYKGRTAVERINSRLDNVFGFEFHYIRGEAKMRMRMSLALVVMLAMAVGRIRNGCQEEMRSLVLPVAA